MTAFLITPLLIFAWLNESSGSPSPPGTKPPPGTQPPSGGGGGGAVVDPTNPSTVVQQVPSLKEIAFDSKVTCQSQKGAINWINDAQLLTCNQIVPFGQPPVQIFSELEQLQQQIASGQLKKPTTELERLKTYFSIVYKNADKAKLDAMTETQMIEWWKNLELYYNLPLDVMPTTPITKKRQVDNDFYRVPAGVILDQDINRLGTEGAYLEVVRFGPMFNFFDDPTLFVGTFYYPVKGSGLYLPLGRTLIAYNKVHAMKLLNASNASIVRYCGRDFQSFLKKDSTDPKYAAEASVSVCVANKRATSNNVGCSKIYNYFTQTISYKPSALNAMIDEMCAGKSLRYETRQVAPNTPPKKTLVYYGSSDTGDKYVAQLARNRGYTTLQFLREAQMELNGDAIVGYELMHLVENIYSQTALMRLDPFKMPFYLPKGMAVEVPVNYLLEQAVKGVDVKAVINTEFVPFQQKVFDINVVVEERNTGGQPLQP
jgi:hypothetical protein